MVVIEIANLIVLTGAVFMAFTNMIKNGGSGISWIGKKREKVFNEKVDERIDKNAPKYLQEISEALEEIKTDNKRTMIVVANMNEKLDHVEQGNKDMLRREMNKIYSKYAPYGMITQYDKSDFDQFYQDYIEEHGNSYAGDLRAQVSDWKIVDTTEHIPNFRGR